MNYNIKKIISIIKAQPLSNIQNNSLKFVQIDSRTISYPEQSIFFALTGKNNNGHDFIVDAYKKGIRNFVIESKADYENLQDQLKEDTNILHVNNGIQALQKLAEHHRKRYTIPVIGITGSNGKTIIKEWLYSLLHERNTIHRSPKSYNSQVGVPLSVLGLNEDHELAVFEAGISTTGEMEKLEKMIKPDIGIFTNIGSAHQEGFKSKEEKINEKLELFQDSQMLIYCKDQEDIHNLITKNKESNFNSNLQLFSWSTRNKADLRINSIKKGKATSTITGVYRDKEVAVEIPFIDHASVENAIHCWLYMLINGYEQSFIQDGMYNLSPVEMRLELKEGINNCTLINDTYNSDINSLSIALDYLMQQNQHVHKTLILSDILQSGLVDKSLYKEVAKIVMNKGVNRIIGIGTSISANSKYFEINSSFYKDTNEFLQNILNEKFENEAVLIKGARIFTFENITEVLQKKVHNTILEINLQSLVNNLNIYRTYLKPGTKIMAMVKAFSYGSGTYEIANLLQYQNVDYLAVAYADEGVELRKAGVEMPIMVMNPDIQSFPVIFSSNLEPEIYCLGLLNKLIDIRNRNRTEIEVPIHIKIDTGMHRLGFVEDDISQLIDILNANPKISVKSIFSHLISSEDATRDELTRLQIEYFKKVSDLLTKSLNYPVLLHILNSAGSLRFPEAQFDMVRLGIGLYGFDASDKINAKLENVSTFKTVISQIKEVKKGETVGYSGNIILKRDSTIATTGVGYADGFPRSMGNGVGTVIVNGHGVSTIGNICMDMTMIDITGIDVNEGDEVIIFGEELSLQKYADRLQTIPYEVLTNISARVKRIYYKE